MNAKDESAELAPSRDPAAYGRRPLMSGVFWVMMTFCALCLLAAAAVVMLGPRLAPVRRVAELPAPAAAAASAPALPAALSAPAEAAPAGGLDARVQHLEAGQSRLASAAAAALAAAELSDAAARPQPFAGELAVAARLLPGSPDALALAPLAQQGAPTRAALAAELTEIGGQASAAAHTPGKDASFLDRLTWMVSRVVTLRRVDASATGPDAALVAAQRAADDGDLEAATRQLDALPEGAKAALAPWRDKAQRRIEIDRRIAALRAGAMQTLAAVEGQAQGSPQTQGSPS